MDEHPQRIAHYRVDRLLGLGGESETYDAFDERFERPVALKRLAPDAALDRKARLRFRREAGAVARLRHPAVVRIHDLLETAEGDWLVMDPVEGVSLAEVLRHEKQLSAQQALPIAQQLAEGLAAAHAKGVIHRGLKTESVLVNASGRVQMLDFGLAKDLWMEDVFTTSLTADGAMLGTCRGLAPEQALGGVVDPRADLFSLGALIYEVLVGESPFAASSPATIASKLAREPHIPLIERLPKLQPALSVLVDRLLSKEPAKRPKNATEVANALHALASDSPSLPVPVSWPSGSAEPG